jgi:preprotein translocase subunit SecG
MLNRVLVILLILDSILLMAAVLFQSGKGGGMAASFGGVSSSADAILGSRQAGNLLTKISWWTGGLFLAIAFLLSLTGSGRSAPRSILDQTFTQPTPGQTAPAPQPGANVLPIQPAAPAATGQAPATPPTSTKTP